ncbi:MAG: hypothetical protein IJC87_05215 [Clostridia bacterium]|nr:hypothetical protein [Clostridia bacterium]
MKRTLTLIFLSLTIFSVLLSTSCKHKHAYTEQIIEPTCENQGYTIFSCDCGDNYKSNYVDNLGHTYTENITEPTCESQGYTTFTCSCGNNYKDNYVDAKEHSFYKNVCTACSFNIFDNLENLNYSAVEEDFLDSFVVNVSNNSTQGKLSFGKYGAEILFSQDEIHGNSSYNANHVIKIKSVNGVDHADVFVKFTSYTPQIDKQNFDFTHQIYIVDKTIYSQQPNNLNNMGEFTLNGFSYLTPPTLALVEIATTLSIKSDGEYTGEKRRILFSTLFNFSQSYEQIKQADVLLYYTNLGNYHVVKLTLNETDVENFLYYVYDEDYDLVSFYAKSDSDNLNCFLKPLSADFTIPTDIIDKINDYLSENEN